MAAAEALTQSQAVRLEVLIVYDWSNSPFVFLIWIVDLRYGEVQTVNTWATLLPSFGQCAVTHSGLRCGNCNGE